MKKLFLLFIFLSLFFFLPLSTGVKTYAIELPSAIQIPGETCGNADAQNPEYRKCCPIAGTGFEPNFDLGIPGFGFIMGKLTDLLLNKFLATDTIRNRFVAKWKGVQEMQCPNGTPVGPPDSCTCQLVQTARTTTPEDTAQRLCSYVGDDTTAKGKRERQLCTECVTGTGRAQGKGQGVWTGLGCVYSEFGALLRDNIFRWAIAIAGLTAILCIIYSAIILQTSRANPEKIKQAQERMTSCIIGLLLIIFSVFILKLIGVDILRIPGFG